MSVFCAGFQGNTALMHACKSGQDQISACQTVRILLASEAQAVAANHEVMDLKHMM